MVVVGSEVCACNAHIGSVGPDVCSRYVRHSCGLVMPPDLASGVLCDGMILDCRVCRAGLVASDCFLYVFARPLLNNLIKKLVCIVSMKRPGV